MDKEKTLRELAMDVYEDILHAEQQIAMVQKHIPHLYPKLYEECERAHAGVSHALNLAHKVLSAASDAEKAPAGKSEDDGLAHTLLSWVDRNRKELQAMSAMSAASGAIVASVFSTLLDDIEELCKWQIGSPRRLIVSLTREFDENNVPAYSDEIFLTRASALRAAFARRFSDAPELRSSARIFAHFTEWVYWVTDIREKHVEWAKAAKECGLIDAYTVDYEPEQDNR